MTIMPHQATIFSELLEPKDHVFTFPVKDEDTFDDLRSAVYDRYRSTFQQRNVSEDRLEFLCSRAGVVSYPENVLPDGVREYVAQGKLELAPLRARVSEFLARDEGQEKEGLAHIILRLRVSNEEGTEGIDHAEQLLLEATAEEATLLVVQHARDAPKPSVVTRSVQAYKEEQENRPIYNGRPGHLHGPPLALYSRAFAELSDALGDMPSIKLTPPNKVTSVAKLCTTSPSAHEEDDYASTMVGCLEDILQTDLVQKDREFGHYASGQPLEGVEAEGVFVFVELMTGSKNEMAGLWPALAYRKHVSQPTYDAIRNASCCPCILISIRGSLLCVSGAMFVQVPVVQPFTEYIHLRSENIEDVARVLHATADAMKALKEEYGSLQPSSVPVHARLFPRPTYPPLGPADDEKVKSLVFLGLPERTSAASWNYAVPVFLATMGGRAVVVKFCKKYGAEAHRLLADRGLAPALHLCFPVGGGLLMVVRDFVRGAAGRLCVADDCAGPTASFPLPGPVLADMERAVEVLHRSGYVSGNVLWSNIAVVRRPIDSYLEGGWVHVAVAVMKASSEASATAEVLVLEVEERGMLVDFTWAGKEGEAEYPWNVGELDCPGAEARVKVEKAHDRYMLERLRTPRD
ncbi:hypothetical protein OF83DRAFT_1290069 [Amylostereum chailletii]|nr:hypothetical protein OF83DRAFT_1290069 [Amylostereum chailletii]